MSLPPIPKEYPGDLTVEDVENLIINGWMVLTPAFFDQRGPRTRYVNLWFNAGSILNIRYEWKGEVRIPDKPGPNTVDHVTSSL